MRVAKFWAFAKTSATDPEGFEVHRALWRGSDASEADAQALADRAVIDVASAIRMGRAPDWYNYAESTRPEPMLDELLAEDGRRIAAITINRYGASILNTARTPFVDVDVAPRRARGVRGLFGGRVSVEDVRAELVADLEAWVDQRQGRSARVYRTAAGMRYLLHATDLDPTGIEAQEMFERFKADPLYANLCRAQRCYRARLSPKPWRIGVESPVGHVKYDRAGDEFLAWNRDYQAKSTRYAVCRLDAEFGTGRTTPDAQRVLELHDAATGVGTGLPLA